MQLLESDIRAFFALIRAGLWEEKVQLIPFGDVNWNSLYRLAQEQSVVGLLAAGLEHVEDTKVPQTLALSIAGDVLQLEQRNKAMNDFIACTVAKLRSANIYTLVIKGQGVAQCYEKPLWRSSGDVDFFLSEENFIKAREYFRPMVEDGYDPDGKDARNISAKLDSWDIELHNNQFTTLSGRVDKGLKEVQDAVFYGGNVRSWMDGGVQVFLPGLNEDVVIIFTHFLKHFYKGGLGLRQICDWCRLLWTYRDSLNVNLLENRLRAMGLITEWKAFAAYAVDYLGMPTADMPLYSNEKKWTKKAQKINDFVLEVGNMGHSRDNSYYGNKFFLMRKIGALGRRLGDMCRHARIFPLDSLRFFPSIVINGLVGAAKGVG